MILFLIDCMLVNILLGSFIHGTQSNIYQLQCRNKDGFKFGRAIDPHDVQVNNDVILIDCMLLKILLRYFILGIQGNIYQLHCQNKEGSNFGELLILMMCR